MSIPLERSADALIARNFDKVAALLLDTGGITAGIRWGSTTFTFTGGTGSLGVNQPHGLGVVPTAVWMGGWWVLTGTRLGTAHVAEPAAWDVTQFPCIASVQGAGYSGTATAFWIAIG